MIKKKVKAAVVEEKMVEEKAGEKVEDFDSFMDQINDIA